MKSEKFKWTRELSPLVLFEREAKHRGFTVKVVGDYAYKKSQRNDSDYIKFFETTADGIRVDIFHMNQEVERIEVEHGLNMFDKPRPWPYEEDADEEIVDVQLRACLDWLYKSWEISEQIGVLKTESMFVIYKCNKVSKE